MKTMQEYETLKVYGTVMNRWTVEDEQGRVITRQVELPYKEYDSDGNLIRKGSEDFSPERMDAELNWYRIWMWDGNHYNRGGHRYFEPCGDAKIRRADVYKLRQLAMIWNAKRNPALIEVRA